MKDQAETATGKREGDLKDDRPGNVQDHHHPHLVPREAEHSPASQAGVLGIHNDRFLLQAGIRLAEGSPGCPEWLNGGNYSSRIDSRPSTSNDIPDRRIDCLENSIKQIAAHMGLFQRQGQLGDNSRDVDRNSATGAHGNEHEAREEQQVQDGGRV